MFAVKMALYKLLQLNTVRDEEITFLEQQDAIREAFS